MDVSHECYRLSIAIPHHIHRCIKLLGSKCLPYILLVFKVEFDGITGDFRYCLKLAFAAIVFLQLFLSCFSESLPEPKNDLNYEKRVISNLKFPAPTYSSLLSEN